MGKGVLKILAKMHLKLCQTSKMEIFPEIVNYQKPLPIFIKRSSLDVW